MMMALQMTLGFENVPAKSPLHIFGERLERRGLIWRRRDVKAQQPASEQHYRLNRAFV